MPIDPSPRSLFLCDSFERFPNGKANLYGIFTRARADSYPHERIQIVVFAELVGGLGNLPFTIEIVNARSGATIFRTRERVLRFKDRLEVMQLAHAIHFIRFSSPGVYFVQLWCNNRFIADARLVLE